MATKEQLERLSEELGRLVDMVKTQDEKIKAQGEQLKKQQSGEIQRPLVVMSSRRIERFRDRPTSSSDPTILEWVADMRTHVSSQGLQPQEFAAFLIDHLTGRAKQEILGRGEPVTKDAEEIIKVLLKVFGDGDNLPLLQQKFYAYTQKDEDLISCSLNMVQLYDKIVNLDDSFKPCRNASLKGRFAEAVKDDGLKRELRRLNVESPELTFFELRDRAVHWLGKVPEKRSAASYEQHAEASDVNEILKRQEKLIQQQHQQIEKLMAKLKSEGSRDRQYKRKCYNCRATWHVEKDCPEPRRPRPAASGRTQNLN